ncbi:MAG: hypothetical protein LBF74_14745, partial [Treponema sp.]|nr:hypothetical protein [Treponema sp.]
CTLPDKNAKFGRARIFYKSCPGLHSKAWRTGTTIFSLFFCSFSLSAKKGEIFPGEFRAF